MFNVPSCFPRNLMPKPTEFSNADQGINTESEAAQWMPSEKETTWSDCPFNVETDLGEAWITSQRLAHIQQYFVLATDAQHIVKLADFCNGHHRHCLRLPLEVHHLIHHLNLDGKKKEMATDCKYSRQVTRKFQAQLSQLSTTLHRHV